ncbi:hypothetical protein BDR03DRAFT_1008794 [Suillus americanus]|nr:hypothetical protein BDR03DRAFT_1008794 [Suillus americanus]
MNHAQDDAIKYVPNMPPSRDFMSAIARDPIPTVHTIVRVMRASGLRQQCFSEIVKVTKQTDLQLLHDIDICWSSTLLMIEHAILLHVAINRFLDSHDFPELKKYKLNDVEWQALDVFKDILSPGLDKLKAYRAHISCVPAYDLAMVINPAMKLNWFLANAPHQMQRAKNLVLTELQTYSTMSEHDVMAAEATSDVS